MADEKEEVDSHDPHFEPIISLPQVDVKTLEEEEEELLKLRARLYRYDADEDPPEWKERGTGDIKLLKHPLTHTCRLLMRRDKTYKICANHFIIPDMELKPNCGSDRAWVWSTPADFADEEAKKEVLAIKFANAEKAQKFKQVFEEAQSIAKSNDTSNDKDKRKSTEVDGDKSTDDADEVTKKLDSMTVKDKNAANTDKSEKSQEKSSTDNDKEQAER